MLVWCTCICTCTCRYITGFIYPMCMCKSIQYQDFGLNWLSAVDGVDEEEASKSLVVRAATVSQITQSFHIQTPCNLHRERML